MRRMKGRRLLTDTEGSGIIWAMGVGAFMLLLAAAVLTIAFQYHTRSVRNGDERQAYLTARSGADLIVQEFTSGSEAAQTIYDYLSNHTTWSVDDVGFPEEMGSCSLMVVLAVPEEENAEQTIKVTASSVYEERSRTVSALLVGVLERKNEDTPWEDSTPIVSGDEETEAPLVPGGVEEEETPRRWYLSAYIDGA